MLNDLNVTLAKNGMEFEKIQKNAFDLCILDV
jgi:hypothetical protein